jgi:Domain of unknown function (DUF5615)
MKFKLDENLPGELVGDLRSAGHEAQTAPEEGLTGAPDPVLAERVRTERRVLLTMDKGIADVRAYPPEQFAGIILFRPPSSGRGAVLAFVRRNLSSILGTDPTGRLMVVSERGIRIR